MENANKLSVLRNKIWIQIAMRLELEVIDVGLVGVSFVGVWYGEEEVY